MLIKYCAFFYFHHENSQAWEQVHTVVVEFHPHKYWILTQTQPWEPDLLGPALGRELG